MSNCKLFGGLSDSEIEKRATAYVCAIKNGLVRRVAFPFDFYDADGLGESRGSLVYVVKSSQFFFSLRKSRPSGQ